MHGVSLTYPRAQGWTWTMEQLDDVQMGNKWELDGSQV